MVGFRQRGLTSESACQRSRRLSRVSLKIEPCVAAGATQRLSRPGVGLMASMAKTRRAADEDRRYQALHENERRLFARFVVDHSPVTRDAIVAQFMPLARKLAWRYRDADDLEDLEQIAAIGLLKAIERFDPERGLAFSTLAFPTILGELRRHLRDRAWSVRPPRDIQTLAARVDYETSALRAELGRSPRVPEIAARVERTVEQIVEVLQAATARRAVSLDHRSDDDARRIATKVSGPDDARVGGDGEAGEQ